AAEIATRTRVPIVAITANAMSEDRQRCEDAGMDDYLSKPFRRRDLAEVIARWLRRPQAEAGSGAPAIEAGAGREAPAKRSAVRDARSDLTVV
ncbi:MAG: response regulator, partial [Gammaproteobacteria bacterium]